MQDKQLERGSSERPGSARPSLLARLDGQRRYWDERLAAGLDFAFRVGGERVGPVTCALTRGQERLAGLNFAVHDHLSLSSHPHVCAAAAEAIGRWGLHSGSPATRQGILPPARMLEERLAELLCCREATLFPSGWAAGYSVVRALVGEADHVVLDALAHPCFGEAARAGLARLHQTANGEAEAVVERLADVRARDGSAGILVVTHSFFGRNASVPDLRRIRDACRSQGATLLVATGADLGSWGDGGLGFLGESGLLGEVDLVVGSLAKTFATNGGFVASRARSLRPGLRSPVSPAATSAALSPVQAATALAALDVVRSSEGARRRLRLSTTASRLRDRLTACAFQMLGRPGPSVSLVFGDAGVASLATREALARGALVELAEARSSAPELGAGWLLHLMADHTDEHVDQFVAIASQAAEHAGAALPGRLRLIGSEDHQLRGEAK